MNETFTILFKVISIMGQKYIFFYKNNLFNNFFLFFFTFF